MIHGIYQMTPRQFRKAIDAGVFGENQVELLGGIPFIMSQNPPHSFASRRLRAALPGVGRLHRSGSSTRSTTLELGQWQPLADTVVFRGPDTIYATRLARAGDVALLVEVSDTTYAKDSGPKLRRYASYRIPVYWIVNLNRRIVEVRTGPFGKGKQAGYAHCRPLSRGRPDPRGAQRPGSGADYGIRSASVSQMWRDD